MLAQLSSTAYLRGDGSYYVRDASRLANGHLPQSRYSPGFALYLAPLVLVTRYNHALAGTLGIVLNVVIATIAFVALHGLLRSWLPPVIAAVSVAVLALSQGVLTYFAEVRPEPLCLLLLTGMFLALHRQRLRWGVALGVLVMLVRIALGPVVLVPLVISVRRRPALLALTAMGAAVAATAYMVVQSPVEAGYIDIGATYPTAITPMDKIAAVFGTVGRGVVNYGVYGLPRLFLPFGVLTTPIGALLGATTTALIAFGAFTQLRRRDADHRLLVAMTAGFAIYLLLLLVWPVRHLSAVRFITPVPAIPLLGIAAASTWVATRFAPKQRGGVAVMILTVLAVISLGGSLAAVPGHRSDDVGPRGFIAAQEAARGALPLGTVMSSKPGATELLIGRRSFAFPLRGDVDEYARRTGSCAAVLTPDVEERAAAWVQSHRDRTLALAGQTEVVTISRPWCTGDP